ncbi:hypothetical protein, partial [Parabacteroides sp. 52]|uniref:hypothetical protein n=1 Tax=Parabacteroides sp. 52 TaxID=2302940 RepID=UPI0013D0FEA3
SRWRLWCMMLLALLATNASLLAQVNWELGYPRWSSGSEILTVEGDEGFLEVYFTPSADVANAAIEFTLPVNIQYIGIENAADFTTTSTGTVATGQKVTAKLKAGIASSGSPIQARLKVKALCGAATGTNVSVQILSGSTPVSGSAKTAAVQTQTPAIQMMAVASKVDYSAANEIQTIEYKLSASNGKANAFKVILKVDEYTTLSNFTFGGSSVTEVLSADKKTYTLTLSDLSSTEKVLSFKGTANRIGSHLVTPTVQYPAAKNCTTTDGQVVTMAFPSVAGAPVMEAVSMAYVASDGLTPLTAPEIIMDGVTPVIVRSEVKNNSIFTAIDMSCILILNASNGALAYWNDLNKFYYQLEGKDKVLIPSSWISTSKVLTSNTTINYKDTIEGKPKDIVITFPETVKLTGGKTITIWGTVVSGKIYDNENKTATSFGNMRGCFSEFSAKNEAGVIGIPSSRLSCPHGSGLPTMTSPSEFSLKPGETITQVLPLHTGHSGATGAALRKIYIQLPSWLKLDNSDGDPFTWGTKDGATIFSPVDSENDASIVYRFYAPTSYADAVLRLKYTSNGSFSPTEENKTGEIVYWVDVDVAGGTTLEKLVRHVQPVTLFCKQEGVVLDNFSPYRITRGLRDSDENHLPDSDTPALDAEMNHNIYIKEDEGEFHWDMTIKETSSYLYLPVTSPGFLFNGSTKHFNLKTDEVAIEVNNSPSSLTADVVYASNNKGFYLLVNASGTPFTAGQTIKIKLPFSAKNRGTALLTTECFVSNFPITDPFNCSNDPNRKGKDQKEQNLTVGDIEILTHCANGIFDDGSNQEKTIVNSYMRMTLAIDAPYFYKEVRRFTYASLLSLEIPDGYELTDNLKLVVTRGSLDAKGPASQELYPKSVDGSTYTYDLSTLYDFNYSTEKGPALDPNKWVLAEDYWMIGYNYTVKATKGATIGATKGKITGTYKNLVTGEDMVTVGIPTYTYNGVATQLSNVPVSLPVNGSSLSIPIATVGNPNATTLDHVWLYVGGNVSDVKFNSASGQGQWINAGSLVSGGTQDYNITFNYLGRTDGENKNDTITIYTVSDFGDPAFPADPTQYAIDSDELKNYLGARKNVILIPGEAKVGGSIDAGTSLTYGTEYNFEAVIDGTSSPGVLINPQMTITIPVGQEYIPGSLSLNFRGTTAYDLSDLITVLTTDNTNGNDGPGAERTLVFSLKDILGENVRMPGNLSTEPADQDVNKRKAILTARFKPMCNTQLTGIRFTGELEADNITGTQARLSPAMFPVISMAYTFSVGATIDGGNMAFNKEETDKTLKVVIKKVSGATANVNTDDYILLEMPDVLNLDASGSINVNTAVTGASGNVTPISNTAASGVRTIKLPVPAAEMNAYANKGVGEDIEYEIPITYTADVTDGAQLIEAKYYSLAKFSNDCNTTDVALDGDDVEVGILTTTASPFKVVVDESLTLSCSTSDFGGDWYENADRTGQLSSSTITPTTAGTFTYYASVIIDGTDYGTVPVTVIVYPSLDFSVVDAAICPAGSIDLSTLVSGDAVASGTTTVL